MFNLNHFRLFASGEVQAIECYCAVTNSRFHKLKAVFSAHSARLTKSTLYLESDDVSHARIEEICFNQPSYPFACFYPSQTPKGHGPCESLHFSLWSGKLDLGNFFWCNALQFFVQSASIVQMVSLSASMQLLYQIPHQKTRVSWPLMMMMMWCKVAVAVVRRLMH